MPEPTGNSDAASFQDEREGLEAEKLDLEIRKLHLEVATLGFSNEQQLEKLKVEISELRKGPRRAMLATLLTAGLSFVIGVSTGGATLVFNANAQRESSLETYHRQLADVSNASAAARSAAIIGLASELKDGTERGSQTSTLLTHRLAAEQDAGTLAVLVRTLAENNVKVEDSVMKEAIHVNQEARASLSDAYGQYVASIIGQDFLSNKKRERGNGLADLIVSWSSVAAKGIQDLPTRARREEPAIKAYLDAHDVKADPDAIYALLTDRDFEDSVKDVVETVDVDSAPRPNEQRQRLFAAFLAIAASGEVLGKSLEAVSTDPTLRRQDLSKITILNLEGDDLNLANAKLSRAFIAGSARGADFQGSDLSAADISQLDVTTSKRTRARTNLCAAQLGGASLPSTIIDGSTNELPNLRLANWWESRDVTLHYSDSRIVKFQNRLNSQKLDKDTQIHQSANGDASCTVSVRVAQGGT